MITAAITTSANETDESQLIPLVDKERDYREEDAIKQQGGDKGYVGHAEELEERAIKNYVIPRDNMKKAEEKKNKNNHFLHLRKLRYKVEQKYSEDKNKHGMAKAKYRGILKVRLQCLITYLTINLKRITNILNPSLA